MQAYYPYFVYVLTAAIQLDMGCAAIAQRVQFPTPAQPVQFSAPYGAVSNPYAAPAASPTYVSPVPAPNYAAPASVPPTLGSPAPITSYPSYPTSPVESPTSPPGTYASPGTIGTPTVLPPPTFDPYSAGGAATTMAAPTSPYPYTTPAPAPYLSPAPQPAAGVPPGAPVVPQPYQQPGLPPATYGPQPAPFQYQPAPYDITTSGEGYWAKTQRFLQELSMEYTYLYGDHSDDEDFGLNRVELSTTFAFPMFYNLETPLLVTPGFAFNWLNGPQSDPPLPGPPPVAGGPDLPAQLYDAYLDLAWYPRFNEWLGAELGFRTGVYSDFDHVDSDSLRFMGRGAGSIAIAPDMDIIVGAVYLDRVDVKILPVAGLYYRPTPDWDLYLVFPNPKARTFLATVGNTKWWGYAAGEYGGGSWSVDRQTTTDRIDYNDIRVIGGLEWETQTQIRGHLEIGYVFDREIVFVSGDPPNFTPDDTIMLRAGIDF